MPLLTITRASATKCRVVLTADDGAVVDAYEANLMSPRAQQKLAAATGLTTQRIAAAAVKASAKGADPAELPYATAGTAAAGPFAITLRGMHQSLDTGKTVEGPTPHETLVDVLDADPDAFTAAEPVLQWDGQDRLCCLDVDYHALPLDSRPSVDWLNCRAATIQPRPVAYHVSHGRGVKLFFTEQPGFTARELAAVAAVGWLNLDARATCDLVRITRHPAYPRPGYPDCGAVHWQTPGTDLGPVAAWLQRSADPEAVDDWLDARGWKRGQTLPHEECPVNPCGSHGEPVLIGEEGIFCHKCSAGGYGLGRKPGWVPWCSLVGGVPPRAAGMIRHATHWTHARLILRAETRLPDSILEPAYRAAVKIQHGPMSDAAAAVGPAGADMIRMDGRWVTPDGATTYSQNIDGLVASLPAVWIPGTREVDRAKHNVFTNAGDISHYGYFAVSPVQGCAIYGHHMKYPDGRVAFATPAPWCRAKCPPRYVAKVDRMPEADAWGIIEQVFPGLNRGYVRLLIALKGLAEGGSAQAPFVIVKGISSSAKSSTAHIAASICGDVASEPTYTADESALMRAVAESLDKGSFVILNEIFKCASRSKLKPRQAVDPILTLTPAAVTHRLYIGPRPLGRLPALVLTDTEIPPSVRSDAQLGRRLVLVEQTERVEWNETVANAGFGAIGRFRLWKPEAAAACDAILSNVIDDFFREPMSVKEIAGKLGFSTLEESGLAMDNRAILLRFFAEVMDAPNLTGDDAKRFSGPGWKAIKRGDTGTLADVWGEINNGPQGEDWAESRTAQGEDWTKMLGCTGGQLVFESITRKGNAYVRFRQGPRHTPTWASANGAALPAGVDPAKLQSDA